MQLEYIKGYNLRVYMHINGNELALLQVCIISDIMKFWGMVKV